ncbi:MAG TPA: hypothetical protein VJ782_09215 [Aeromicrobium sp.]|nr:hypothetical protein [Aeromicrobium sp.]
MALLLTIAALTGCGTSREDITACRTQFVDLQRALDEGGNPGRAGFTPRMTARWDALHAQIGRLGTSASGDDCPDRFEGLRAEIRDLESVLSKIDDYDVALLMRRAEADLDRTAEKSGASYATDYVLITLLRTMRERGADAEKVLAPLVARVDAAKPGDEAERNAAMVALYNVASSDAAFADFQEARESIENYEFDED